MEITIRIDNGDARVFVRQIFANHTGKIEEGNYIFALPSQATVSDFAVWDGPTRIPAVVLERKRAEDIYTQLKQQAIDPGLLQMGERGSKKPSANRYSARASYSIQPHGTKRLEIEYHQSIPVENLKSYFAIPLRPDAYASQAARHLRINFELRSEPATANFQAPAKVFPLRLDEVTPHLIRGHFEGDKVNLSEDFVVTYDLDPAGADNLNVLTYRNPVSGQPAPTEIAPIRSANEPGFFEAEALLGYGRSSTPGAPGNTASGAPKTLVILFDTSLSMQWEKLERSYQALESLLRTLRPADRFNLLLFNNQVQIVQPAPVAAEPVACNAFDVVRSSKLRGGTESAACAQTDFSRQSGGASSPIAERRRRHPRTYPERQARQLVCG